MAESNHTVELAVATPNGETQNYTLQEIRTGLYQCDIDTSAEGLYQTMIVQYDETGNAVDYFDTAWAVSYSAEYDAFADDGEGLLESICAHSDGMVTGNLEKLASVRMDTVMIVLAIICAALMLADFIIRLLRWKDVKELFARIGDRNSNK